MAKGTTCSARAIAGTPVFRIVVSSDSMKKATAISQGNRPLRSDGRAAAGASAAGLEARETWAFDNGICRKLRPVAVYRKSKNAAGS